MSTKEAKGTLIAKTEYSSTKQSPIFGYHVTKKKAFDITLD